MTTIDSVRHLTVADYHKMTEVGILAPNEHVELIHGVIQRKAPIGAIHLWTVNYLGEIFILASHGRYLVSVQNPVRLSDDSEPEPDLSIIAPPNPGELRRTPTAADVLLLIEVSDTTLAYDRNVKVPLYAAAGIPEVWVIDATSRTVEQYLSPQNGAYQSSRTWRGGETIPTIAGMSVIVDEIFA